MDDKGGSLMNIEKVETSEDINRLMNELNNFHDYVILQIAYTSGATVSPCGIHPLAGKRNVNVKLGAFIDGTVKEIELLFYKVSQLDLLPIDEKYDSLIIKASLSLTDGHIVFSDCDSFENSNSLRIVAEDLEVHEISKS